LSIIDRRTGTELFTLTDSLDSFSSSIFLPSMVGGESLLATVSRNNTLKIFNIANGQCLSSFTPESSSTEMSNLACAIDTPSSLLSAKNAVFYSSTSQGTVHQWQVNNHGNVAALLAQTRFRSSSIQ
jgi:WD40 repeat protein